MRSKINVGVNGTGLKTCIFIFIFPIPTQEYSGHLSSLSQVADLIETSVPPSRGDIMQTAKIHLQGQMM